MDSLTAAWRPLLTLLVVVLAGWLVHALAPILTPFLLATALAYLFDPLVERLVRLGISRTVGTILIMFAMLLGFVLIGLILAPLVQAQVRLFVLQIPRLMEWGAQTLMPWLTQTFGVDMAHDKEDMLNWARQHVGELSKLTHLLPQLADGGLVLLGLLANLLIVPVVTFYLLRDWHRILAQLADWVPQRFQSQTLSLLGEIDAVLSQFARGQLLVIATMVLFYCLGLWLAGLDYALAVGFIAGILVFVPYLGVVVGVLLATLAGLAQYGSLGALLPVWGVFVVGHVLESVAVTPWLVGERVGLHPVAVIFALMAFGQLFGFVGLLVAIPAAAASLVALRRLKTQLD